MCDVPELQKIVIVLGGATCAMQQAMNVHWFYRTTMVQTGTKVKCCNTVWYVCNIHHVWLDSIPLLFIQNISQFWLAKSTRIIHHDQLLNCHWTVKLNRWLRKPGDEVELFRLFEQNGGTVGRTLYSFHGEIFSKNIARTTRSQLDGQHLLFGVY